MAIITTGDLSDYLGSAIDAYSAEQQALAVDAANAECETYCGRTFAAADYTQWLNASGSILLPATPVSYVSRVGIGRTDVAQLTNGEPDAHMASYAVNATALRLTVIGGAAAGTTSLTLANYASLSALKAAVDAAGTWTLTLSSGFENEVPSALRPGSATWDPANGAQAYLYGADTYFNDVEFDTDTGVLRLSESWGAWPDDTRSFGTGERLALVQWRGGYETMPDDLVGVALKIAASFLTSTDSAGASGTIRKETTARGSIEYETSASAASGASGSVNPDYAAILDRYRVRKVGCL